MFLNSDTSSRNKINALQALEAFTIDHPQYTKTSGVFQGPVGCSIGQRYVPELAHMH